jgi:hypothetical protein
MQQGLVPQCYSRQEAIVVTQEHFQQPAGKDLGPLLLMEWGLESGPGSRPESKAN